MSNEAAAAGESPVLIEERPTADGRRIGIARLNRPRAINALDLDVCERLQVAAIRWADDPAIVAVVLAGEGPKGFCAGGDVARVIRERRTAQAEPGASADAGAAYGDEFFRVEYRLDRLLHEFPKPLITWAHGVTMGGGVGLSVAGGHRVVTPGLRMAMPEIHIGLFPDVGGGWFLNRVPDEAGLLIALTGVMLNESDAVHARLADHVIAHERLDDVLDALVTADWPASGSGGSGADAVVDRILRDHAQPDDTLPVSPLRSHGAAIRRIFGAPTLPGILAGLADAAAADDWFRQPLANLQQGSPTAAAVTLEYYRRSRLLSLAEVLEMDRILSWNCLRGPDFPEGVRALLIDKDRAPRWSPRTADRIDTGLIAAFFREPSPVA